MSEHHDHDLDAVEHHHWDFMAGEVSSDYLTELLEAQMEALAGGIRHLTMQLDDMKSQYARCEQALSARDAELDILEAANAANGTT